MLGGKRGKMFFGVIQLNKTISDVSVFWTWMNMSSCADMTRARHAHINVECRTVCMPAIIEAYICEAKLICILCIAFVTGGASIGAKHEALASGAVMLLLHSARHKLQTGGRLHCTSLLTLSFRSPPLSHMCVRLRVRCGCAADARSPFGAAERIISLIGSAPQNTESECALQFAPLPLSVSNAICFSPS